MVRSADITVIYAGCPLQQAVNDAVHAMNQLHKFQLWDGSYVEVHECKNCRSCFSSSSHAKSNACRGNAPGKGWTWSVVDTALQSVQHVMSGAGAVSYTQAQLVYSQQTVAVIENVTHHAQQALGCDQLRGFNFRAALDALFSGNWSERVYAVFKVKSQGECVRVRLQPLGPPTMYWVAKMASITTSAHLMCRSCRCGDVSTAGTGAEAQKRAATWWWVATHLIMLFKSI